MSTLNTSNPSVQEDVVIFKKLRDVLGLEDIIQLLLLKNGIRSAYLKEFNNESQDKDIELIKKYFNLHIGFMGKSIFISTHKLPENMDNLNDQQIGELLGYVCVNDFKYHVKRHEFKTKYDMYSVSMDIMTEGQNAQIITNVCRKRNLDKIKKQSDKISRYISKLNKYLDEKLEYVSVIRRIYSIDELIKKIRKNTFDQDSVNEIVNILMNYQYGLMVILHNKGKIDMFSVKFKKVMIRIMTKCQKVFESDHRITVSLDENNQEIKNYLAKLSVQVDDSDLNDLQQYYGKH